MKYNIWDEDKFNNYIYSEEKDGKFCYRTNGKILTEYLFDYAGMFYNKTSIIKIGDKYGFLKDDGNFLLKPQYEYVGYFGLDNKANVRIDGIWKEIDKEGNILGNTPGQTYAPRKNDNALDIVLNIGDVVECFHSKGKKIGKVVKMTEKTFTVETEAGETFWRRYADLIKKL